MCWKINFWFSLAPCHVLSAHVYTYHPFDHKSFHNAHKCKAWIVHVQFWDEPDSNIFLRNSSHKDHIQICWFSHGWLKCVGWALISQKMFYHKSCTWRLLNFHAFEICGLQEFSCNQNIYHIFHMHNFLCFGAKLECVGPIQIWFWRVCHMFHKSTMLHLKL